VLKSGHVADGNPVFGQPLLARKSYTVGEATLIEGQKGLKFAWADSTSIEEPVLASTVRHSNLRPTMFLCRRA
jgi:hypothetical protein